MNLMLDDDDEPVEGMPNVPRDPDKEALRREKMKAYLNPRMRPDHSAEQPLDNANADMAFIRLLQDSANQAGTIGGKSASSAPLANYQQSLMAQNQGQMNRMQQDRQAANADMDRRAKLMQYFDKQQRDQSNFNTTADLKKKMLERQAAKDIQEQKNFESSQSLKREELNREHPVSGAATAGFTSAGKPMSEGMLKAQADLERMQASSKNIDELIKRPGFDFGKVGDVSTRAGAWRSLGNIPIIGGVAGAVGEYGAQGALGQLSPDERQYHNEVQNFIAGKLRRESGATITEPEFKREYERYFPQPGDNEQTLEAKRKARNREILGRRTETGRLDQKVYGEEDI